MCRCDGEWAETPQGSASGYAQRFENIAPQRLWLVRPPEPWRLRFNDSGQGSVAALATLTGRNLGELSLFQKIGSILEPTVKEQRAKVAGAALLLDIRSQLQRRGSKRFQNRALRWGGTITAMAASAFIGFMGIDLSAVGDTLKAAVVPTKLNFSPVGSDGKRKTLAGRASVIDGDTIELQGERVRFNGIDAPESGQLCKDARGHDYRCGAVSASSLAQLLSASSPTRCEFVERDQYGRFVGICSRADGQGIAGLLVRAGMALDWPRHSGGEYAAQQIQAKAERIGIWQGTFQPPWEWRATGRSETAAAPLVARTPNASCTIKGNISNHGRIFHIPGQRDYAKTKIDLSDGERWFCSEAEARSAGWRKAGK